MRGSSPVLEEVGCAWKRALWREVPPITAAAPPPRPPLPCSLPCCPAALSWQLWARRRASVLSRVLGVVGAHEFTHTGSRAVITHPVPALGASPGACVAVCAVCGAAVWCAGARAAAGRCVRVRDRERSDETVGGPARARRRPRPDTHPRAPLLRTCSPLASRLPSLSLCDAVTSIYSFLSCLDDVPLGNPREALDHA